MSVYYAGHPGDALGEYNFMNPYAMEDGEAGDQMGWNYGSRDDSLNESPPHHEHYDSIFDRPTEMRLMPPNFQGSIFNDEEMGPHRGMEMQQQQQQQHKQQQHQQLERLQLLQQEQQHRLQQHAQAPYASPYASPEVDQGYYYPQEYSSRVTFDPFGTPKPFPVDSSDCYAQPYAQDQMGLPSMSFMDPIEQFQAQQQQQQHAHTDPSAAQNIPVYQEQPPAPLKNLKFVTVGATINADGTLSASPDNKMNGIDPILASCGPIPPGIDCGIDCVTTDNNAMRKYAEKLACAMFGRYTWTLSRSYYRSKHKKSVYLRCSSHMRCEYRVIVTFSNGEVELRHAGGQHSEVAAAAKPTPSSTWH